VQQRIQYPFKLDLAIRQKIDLDILWFPSRQSVSEDMLKSRDFSQLAASIISSAGCEPGNYGFLVVNSMALPLHQDQQDRGRQIDT
jgi:hypothetical protein